MTTIVYDHEKQQIACDSRMAKSSGVYADCYDKMRWAKNRLFITSGSTCDLDYFINNFENLTLVNLVDGIEIDCYGIMVENGKAYSVFIHEGVFNSELLICNDFKGSGGKFALAALDFGKTAKEAVEYAITKDCYSGGKVHVYDIVTAKFLSD